MDKPPLEPSRRVEVQVHEKEWFGFAHPYGCPSGRYTFAFAENRFRVYFSVIMEFAIQSQPSEQGPNSPPDYVTGTEI